MLHQRNSFDLNWCPTYEMLGTNGLLRVLSDLTLLAAISYCLLLKKKTVDEHFL